MSNKSDSIWYSSLSTGIFEVDIQHSNIDQLIVILEKTKGESRIKESMDILLHAIENHFKYEEVRFGKNSIKMNQKHRDEHRRVLREYTDIASKVHVSDAKDITKELVGMMKVVLMNHVKDFDCKFFKFKEDEAMTIKLVGIGGMGLMMSPSAKHLKPGSPARFLRIHDRGTKDDRRDACRQAWKDHGADIVHDYEALVGDGDYDGVVVCAGKNGDDCDIFRTLVPLMQRNKSGQPFILHLSTVSAGFAQTAYDFLSTEGIDYVNYPLTGGPLGAENANMLILASGSESIYSKLESTLQTIGNPKYFGSSITAGAEVKLMGQLMVFNGLVGICSAAALKSECFQEELSGSEQAEFFDFLNGGAGGTRQWDVAISKGVRDNIWDQGFMIHHAVVDAIYAAKLCRERGLPALVVIPMVATALAFAYLLDKYEGAPLATHAIVREMIRINASGIDDFTAKHIHYTDVDTSIKNSIMVLPQRVKDSVMLDINRKNFSA